MIFKDSWSGSLSAPALSIDKAMSNRVRNQIARKRDDAVSRAVRSIFAAQWNTVCCKSGHSLADPVQSRRKKVLATALSNDWTDRADELFQQHRQEIYRNTDQLFARLMLFQWVGAITIAMIISPRTWVGQSSFIHIHIWAAIFMGGAITIFPIWMTRAWPGAALTRHIIAVAQMLMSVLLIDLTGGRIETHFHVFGSLVVLSFYRDWRVLIPATIVVYLDHFLRGIYWPYSVYGVLTASPWRSIEHAGWVIFEDAFLVISCLRSIREMRFIANRTAALESSEQNFREIFEEAPVGMAVVGLDDRYVQVNARLCDMVGYSEEELTTRTTSEITYRDDIEESRQLARSLLSGTARSAVEKRYVRKNSEVIWATRTACVIRDETGKPRHYVVMVEDITQRKKDAVALEEAKNEAERANRAKDQFLAVLSHELRTPLTPVLMSAAALEHEPGIKPELRRQFGMMRRNVELEARLIDDLLDLTRVSHGKLQLLVSGPVDVHSLLAHSEQIVRCDARKKSLVLRLDLTANEHHVAADATRINQVFWNLLNNAIKFTPAGGEITVHTANPTAGQLVLTVSDNGIGIDQQTLPFVFRAFEQGDIRGLQPCSGLGLGLSISKAIVELHGGSIRAESAGRGRGAAFTVELSTVLPFPEAQIQTSQPRRLGGKSYRLLVVEDHEPTIAVLTRLLRCQGHDVMPASTVHDALTLASDHIFDFVISDLGLPDGNGIDLMMQLSNDYGLRGIALTGYGMAEDLAKTEQAGFLAHLVKPINFDQLHRVLEQAQVAAG
jgi:two-component system sensor histidine kinase/response regulator